MRPWNRDRLWRWGMGLALPVAIASVCADRFLLETLAGLWDDPTPARLTFLFSSTFLAVGFARNSARLRTLLESQAEPRAGETQPRKEPTPSTGLEPCNE